MEIYIFLPKKKRRSAGTGRVFGKVKVLEIAKKATVGGGS